MVGRPGMPDDDELANEASLASDEVSAELMGLLRQAAADPPREQLPAGERIGRFEILRTLGVGGFGVAYEARDTELGRHVAIKRMRRTAVRPEPAKSPELVKLFRTEAESAARLNHPNIITLYDYGMWADEPYLVLEVLVGETLKRRLAQAALPLVDALDIAIQLARALVHAHERHVIHRDLKPSNVFLCDDGRVKVLDFGLARFVHELETEAGRRGTPAYMAPEQRRGDPQDVRTDVFAS